MERRTDRGCEKRALKPQQVWPPLLARSRAPASRSGLFDLAIDSKLRGCDVVKVRIGDIVSGGRIRTGDRRAGKTGGLCGSGSSRRRGRASWLGLSSAAARSTTTLSRAGSITPPT